MDKISKIKTRNKNQFNYMFRASQFEKKLNLECSLIIYMFKRFY